MHRTKLLLRQSGPSSRAVLDSGGGSASHSRHLADAFRGDAEGLAHVRGRARALPKQAVPQPKHLTHLPPHSNPKIHGSMRELDRNYQQLPGLFGTVLAMTGRGQQSLRRGESCLQHNHKDNSLDSQARRVVDTANPIIHQHTRNKMLHPSGNWRATHDTMEARRIGRISCASGVRVVQNALRLGNWYKAAPPVFR